VLLGEDIAERLLDLGVGALAVARTLPRDAIWRHIATQLVRCVSSSGANYEEARRAESRADFVHKVSIAAKELGEAVYWLRLCARARAEPQIFHPMIDESNELAAILVASARTARKRL